MKKGFTIIEIVVAMLIIGILIVPITYFLNKTIRSFYTGKPSQVALSVVNDAMNEIMDTLRVAKSLSIVEATRIGFIIPINNGVGEFKIVFYLNNGFVVREDDNGTKYVPYYNNPNTSSSELINFSINFKYYSKENILLPPPVDPNQVYAVEISLKGEPNENPEGLPPIEMVNVVRLRNR